MTVEAIPDLPVSYDTALAGDPAALDHLVRGALDALARGTWDRSGPTPPGPPSATDSLVLDAIDAEPLPEHGVGARASLGALGYAMARGAADPSDPACAAHLHCPPLAVAVAADAMASALNQSLDSWDQAPAATALEPRVVGALAELAGYRPARAGGVITSGGTASNLMGLLLARDHSDRGSPQPIGSPRGTPDRIYCSAAAHFSVARGAHLLGLPEHAVVAVPVDPDHRMRPAALDDLLDRHRPKGGTPVAVVATAGTTDLGAIDPLPEVTAIARAHGAWVHVDAAYGGGALFSGRLAPLLSGLAEADSVALDLHKLGWQPIPAGVFLVRDHATLAPLRQRVAYLNPADDERAGYTSLLGNSLRTTRRADVLKIAVTLRALGRSGLGALVDRCHALARHAGRGVRARPRLVLAAEPVLTTVVFRFLPQHASPDPVDLDLVNTVNAGLRRRLLREGRAVVGRTDIDGAVHLKLTLLNPHATEHDVDALLDAVVAAGKEEDLT